MIWRVAAVLAVIFWAVMSGLLLRDVYFPEASRFAVIPPKVVIDLFLRQSDAFGSNLHLYHHKEKMGHASFQISRRMSPNNEVAYDVLARGIVEQPLPEEGKRQVIASWSVSCILAEAERCKHLAIAAEFPEHQASMKMTWKENDAAPEVLVKQGGRVLMNTQDVQMLMAMGVGKDGPTSMLSLLGMGQLSKPPAGAADPPPPSAPTRLQAREGLMVLAGRERKCYILTLPVFAEQEIKMIFTEAGELARIDLPDSYMLLEPLIHGLQDGMR